VAHLVKVHLEWVIAERPLAHFLFEQSRSEWLETVRAAQQATNDSFRLGLSRRIEPHPKPVPSA
jgi:hypothetical protein